MVECDQYLSVKEMAHLLKMHYNTILRAIRQGRMQAVRIGQGKKAAYRIPLSEINRIAFFDLREKFEETK